MSMTEKEVKDSIIHKCWYHKVDDIMGYNLSPDFMDMLRWGYGKIFTKIMTRKHTHFSRGSMSMIL